MNRVREFVKSTVTGGLLVILPVGIFLFVLSWVFGRVHSAIGPLTGLLVKATPEGLQLVTVLVDVLVIILILLVCFVVGAFVRTSLGKIIYHRIETGVLKRAPGYSLIKDVVSQFLGNKTSPFSSVALAQIFGNDTMVTCFVTDTHEDGSSTVFVPTGPNPTSGNIYHMKQEHVHPVKVSVEDAMRTIISCGAGSALLVEAYRAKQSESADQT